MKIHEKCMLLFCLWWNFGFPTEEGKILSWDHARSKWSTDSVAVYPLNITWILWTWLFAIVNTQTSTVDIVNGTLIIALEQPFSVTQRKSSPLSYECHLVSCHHREEPAIYKWFTQTVTKQNTKNIFIFQVFSPSNILTVCKTNKFYPLLVVSAPSMPICQWVNHWYRPYQRLQSQRATLGVANWVMG